MRSASVVTGFLLLTVVFGFAVVVVTVVGVVGGVEVAVTVVGTVKKRTERSEFDSFTELTLSLSRTFMTNETTKIIKCYFFFKTSRYK